MSKAYCSIDTNACLRLFEIVDCKTTKYLKIVNTKDLMLSHDFYLRAYITREKFQVLRKSCNSYPKLIFSGLVLSPRKRRGHIEQQQPHLEVRRVPVPRTLARHRTSAEHSREVATPPKAFDSGLSFQNSGRFSQSFQPTGRHLR